MLARSVSQSPAINKMKTMNITMGMVVNLGLWARAIGKERFPRCTIYFWCCSSRGPFKRNHYFWSFWLVLPLTSYTTSAPHFIPNTTLIESKSFLFFVTSCSLCVWCCCLGLGINIRYPVLHFICLPSSTQNGLIRVLYAGDFLHMSDHSTLTK